MGLLMVAGTQKLFRPMTLCIWQAATLREDFSPLQLFPSELSVPTYSIRLQQHCANVLQSTKKGQLNKSGLKRGNMDNIVGFISDSYNIKFSKIIIHLKSAKYA